MDESRKVIYKIRTKIDSYEVIEEVYTGRKSRLLYGGESKTAQSGIPLDDQDKMLFEYNQRLVELALDLKPEHILLIGGGVYTLASYLSKKLTDSFIDIVEPDTSLDDIASRYFNYQAKDSVSIIHDFGLSYLMKNKKKYDLIIIDAYSYQHIPAEIISKQFTKLATKSLSRDGLLAANVISDIRDNSVISKFHSSYKKYFKYFNVFPASSDRLYFYPSNLIYTASFKKFDLKLKYPPLSWSGILD